MEKILSKILALWVFIFIIQSPLRAELSGNVVAISQCVYDIYIQLDDQKLRDIIMPLGISKGGYKRVDTQELKYLMQKIPVISKQHAGGAAANTLAGITKLGGKTTFIGNVGDDLFGQSYLKDMSMAKVQMEHEVYNSDEDKGTALVILLITPDGERTIVSYLGASLPIHQTAVNPTTIQKHQILFSDAYAWDKDITSKMLNTLYAGACKNKMLTAFGLGNASVVKLYREELLDFMQHINILFGNLNEYQALFDAESIETIIQKLQQTTTIAVLTNADQGALIITPYAVFHTPAKRVPQIVDTTGAGDLFAAGFLYGMTQGYDLEECGKLGSEMAGQIITQVGARLKNLTPEIQTLIKNRQGRRITSPIS